MKKTCERCHEEYEEGEIYSSNYFPYLFCIPCEKEYEDKLWQFRINFMNNQPERSKREDFDKLADEFLDKPISDRGGNWETENGYILEIKEYSSWLNQRCGALNSMET